MRTLQGRIGRTSSTPIFVASLLLLSWGLASCGGSSSGGGNSGCTNPANAYESNIGSTSGGGFNVNIGPSNTDYFVFDNTSLEFGTVYGGLIQDVGQVCLSDITSFSGTSDKGVAVVVGDSYVIKFNDGNYVRFTVNSYSNGVVNLTIAPGLG